MPDVRQREDVVPETLDILASVLTVGLALYVLLRLVRASRARAPEELGLVPIYSDRGAGTFGLLRVNAPFVRVAVYPTFIVIAHHRTYVVPALAIREVSLLRTLFGRRVRLAHDSPVLPSPLTLWSNTPEALVAALRRVAPSSKTAA